MTTSSTIIPSPSPRARDAGAGRRLRVVVLAALACACDAGEPPSVLELGGSEVRCYTATERAVDVAAAPDGTDALVATEGGLLRFDGAGRTLGKWTRCDGLIGHTLRSIDFAPDGTLWIATVQGVSRYGNGTFRGYTTDEGLNDDRAYAVLVDARGRVLVGTHRGVDRLDGEVFVPVDDTHELARRPTRDIHESADGALWFAKTTALTQLRADGTWRVFQRDPTLRGPRNDMVSNRVRRVVTDERGAPWIATLRGLGNFDERAWTHLFHNPRLGIGDGLRDNHIAALERDPAGRLWIGHGSRELDGRAFGIARLDEDGWRYFTTEDGLPDNRVHRVRVDGDDSVWIATSRGAARFDGHGFDLFRARGELASNLVLDIARFDDGRVAVLTGGGIALFRAGERLDLAAPPDDDLRAIAVAGATLHAATSSGLWLLRDGSWSREPSFEHSPIRSVAAREGEVWVLHPRGLFHGRAGAWRAHRGLVAPGEPTGGRVFPGPGGLVWITGAGASGEAIGTGLRGVVRHPVARGSRLARVAYAPDGEPWLVAGEGLIALDEEPRRALSLPRGHVPRVCLWDSEGRLWVGTRDHGLVVRRGGSWTQALLHGRPLPREITALALESPGVLWVGTAAEGAFRIVLPSRDLG